MKIRILFTGRGYPAAEDLPGELTLPDQSDLQEALSAVSSFLPESGLPPSCLVAVRGEHVGTVASCPKRRLRDGDEIVLVAPVAGG